MLKYCRHATWVMVILRRFLCAEIRGCWLVGPLGLEPRTKGFTIVPPFPVGVDYLFTLEGCGTL